MKSIRVKLLIIINLLLFGSALQLKAQSFIFDNCQIVPELEFKFYALESGSAGSVGAVYRFPDVHENTDAIVEITDIYRASLVHLDVTNVGTFNAFQPQVMLNNFGDYQDGYIDFRIRLVEAGTNNPSDIEIWTATAIDVDGDSESVRESIGLSIPDAYALESPTDLELASTPIQDNMMIFEVSSVGNAEGISLTNTEFMMYSAFLSRNVFDYRARVIIGEEKFGAAKSRLFSLNFNPCLIENFEQVNTFPVEWLDFTAVAIDNKVKLEWATSSEINNDFFVIQRADDGMLFEDLGDVKGSGSTNETNFYQFEDPLPVQGRTYYRIKQVDFDGSFAYSPIISATTTNNRQAVEIFPNPAAERLVIRSLGQTGITGFKISSIDGREHSATPSMKLNAYWEIDIAHLPKGLYILQVELDDQALPGKIISVN